MKTPALVVLAFAAGCASMPGPGRPEGSSAFAGGDGGQLLSVDHFVRVRSIAPAMNGQFAQIYVREHVVSRNLVRGSSGVVLFVHGAGTPAEVAFDVPYQDYSWMAYLANAGFDVFAMDTTGYGRSTRPAVDERPLQPLAAQQAGFVPVLMPGALRAVVSAPASRPSRPTGTTSARWSTTCARCATSTKVNLVAWSLGGPRAGGYAAQHPERSHGSCCSRPPTTRSASPTPPADVACGGRRVQHAVARRVRPRTGIARSAAPTSTIPAVSRRGVGGDARFRSGRRDLGRRRAPRARRPPTGASTRRSSPKMTGRPR